MLNLATCREDCMGCVKQYAQKYKSSIKSGGKDFKFELSCSGIPKEYIDEEVLSGFSEIDRPEAELLLDPVLWAKEYLDWHCLDEDGSVWKKKNPMEYFKWQQKNPGEDIFGKSRYHRPYQATVLRCSSKRKILRMGRQIGKTESLVVAMLYHMFVKPGIPEEEGFHIVIIAPFQSQIDLIFKRLRELITSSPKLRNSIYRHVKAPQYTLELNNGSRVIGFTAGTKSGAGAASARGQHANLLCFDESDYLSSDDMDAALSIITNYPEATLWMSSTPTGKREKFYESCYNPAWKEFFYPSYVNPMWSEELEKMFRSQLTSIGYQHEIEASFGEQEQGVFQNVYVDAAKANYDYSEMKYDPTWVYTLGVDWNDTSNGTTLVVVGRKPNGEHKVVFRSIIQRDGWTQLQACDEIAKVNRLWNPIAIYLDKGYGGTQAELLRKWGYEALIDKQKGPNHPDARLRNAVSFDFGSTVEVKDPWTKQPMKKFAKGFMVENGVRFFENQIIKIPSKDQDLIDQILGYTIARTNDSGRRVFEAGRAGDHTLDALLLALVAFALETTSLGKVSFSTEVAHAVPRNLSGETTSVMEQITEKAFASSTLVKGKSNKPEMNRGIDVKQDPVGTNSLLPGGDQNPSFETARTFSNKEMKGGSILAKFGLENKKESARMVRNKPQRRNI